MSAGKWVVLGVVAAIVAAVSCLAMSPPALAATSTVIAWQPSHQDDTGTNGWHEYQVCGDITQRTLALLPGFTNVLCWQTGMGLTTDNLAALQSEIDQENAAHAEVTISVHVDTGSKSGISGCYFPGDVNSSHYAEALLKSVAATMGMTYLGITARSDLKSLDPTLNKAPVKVLLELGDIGNSADRALLSSADGRQRMAAALAKAVSDNTPPPTYNRYEQIDSRLVYSGSWAAYSTSSASGGNYGRANTSGSAVTIFFNGTRLDWIAMKGTTTGKADVYLDDVFSKTIDLANGTAIYQQNVWSTGFVPAGPHRVRISWNTTNAAGKYVTLDAVDVVGTLMSPPPTITGLEPASGLPAGGNSVVITGIGFIGVNGPSGVEFGGTNATSYTVNSATQITAVVPPHAVGTVGVQVTASGVSTADLSADQYTYTTSPTATRYQQTDTRLVYSGTWGTFSTASASGGSYLRANTSGASVTISYNGTRLDWIATKGTTLSKATVSLDGGAPVTVDLAASVVAYQQDVWSTNSLPVGNHTVKISWKTGNAAGKFISIDAVDVVGRLL